MNDDFDFEDLDAAVADLLSDSADDENVVRDRDEIVSAERAEVREKWNLQRESAEKFAKDKAQNFAKNAENISQNPFQNPSRNVPEISRKPAVIPGENLAPQQPKIKSRGQFMDMIHPSSDATLREKPNHAQATNVAKDETLAKNLAPSEQKEIREVTRKEDAFEGGDKSFREELASVIEQKDAKKNRGFSRRFRGEKSEVKPAAEAEDSREIKTENESPKKSDAPQTPFLPDVKVAKNPLSAARPTGEIAAPKEEKLLTATEKTPKDPIKPEPTIELSEDNFVSKFLDGVREEAREDSARQIREKNRDNADHLSRNNAERAPKNDTRAALDSTMDMSQYQSSDTAQIAQPTKLAKKSGEESGESGHHVGRWIAAGVLLLLIGFAIGAWIYLLN